MPIHDNNSRDGLWVACSACKALMWIPLPLEQAARHSEDIHFWCAYGHKQHFGRGETEENKLRRERDRLAQQIAQRDDEIRHQRERLEASERSAVALKGQITKLNKRVSAGVCPCCTRSFTNLRRHIATKHPNYGDDNIVPIKARGG